MISWPDAFLVYLQGGPLHTRENKWSIHTRRNGPDSFLHVTESRQSVNENHVDVAKKACQLLRSSLFTSPGVVGSRTASSNLLKAFCESCRWAGQLKTHFSTQKEGRLPNMGGKKRIAYDSTHSWRWWIHSNCLSMTPCCELRPSFLALTYLKCVFQLRSSSTCESFHPTCSWYLMTGL